MKSSASWNIQTTGANWLSELNLAWHLCQGVTLKYVSLRSYSHWEAHASFEASSQWESTGAAAIYTTWKHLPRTILLPYGVQPILVLQEKRQVGERNIDIQIGSLGTVFLNCCTTARVGILFNLVVTMKKNDVEMTPCMFQQHTQDKPCWNLSGTLWKPDWTVLESDHSLMNIGKNFTIHPEHKCGNLLICVCQNATLSTSKKWRGGGLGLHNKIYCARFCTLWVHFFTWFDAQSLWKTKDLWTAW